MNEWEFDVLENRLSASSVRVGETDLTPGDRVRLMPRPGGDVMDIALQGQIATIEAIEQDYEGVCHLAVVLDDDPGRDLGLTRQPGHRFFFRPTEVEPVRDGEVPVLHTEVSTPLEPSSPSPISSPPATVLVAGIGNIFFGDDGFGVEVAQRLKQSLLPAQVRVVDFGIRGFDLACALDTADVIILVDAYPHGGTSGALKVIEPNAGLIDQASAPISVNAHGLDPASVLKLASAMNITPGRLLLVGCQPETLGGPDGVMGLSTPVQAAVPEAMKLVQSMLTELLHEDVGNGQP